MANTEEKKLHEEVNEQEIFHPESMLVDLNYNIPIKDQKMLLGKYNGFQRYDNYKYPFAKQIERAMRQAFWTPEEISLISDREKFKSLDKGVQEVVINNLLFQTLMDSAQNRGLDSVMAQLVTSSEWEAAFKTQAFFELIHSLSYSHIIREMFSADATNVFDRIYQIPQIKKRTDKEIAAYDFVKGWLDGRLVLPLEELKKHIVILLVHIFFLEGLKFYVSFLVTYITNESTNDSIPGVAKIIKLINFDEDMHVSLVGGVINILQRMPSEGFTHLFNSPWYHEHVTDIVKGIVEDEVEWGKYLLKLGKIPGLTEKTLNSFMKYYANNRLQKIGLPPLYKDEINKPDLVIWFENYKDINKDNTAQQEATAINYNIGTMELDYGDKDLKAILQDLLDDSPMGRQAKKAKLANSEKSDKKDKIN